MSIANKIYVIFYMVEVGDLSELYPEYGVQWLFKAQNKPMTREIAKSLTYEDFNEQMGRYPNNDEIIVYYDIVKVDGYKIKLVKDGVLIKNNVS